VFEINVPSSANTVEELRIQLAREAAHANPIALELKSALSVSPVPNNQPSLQDVSIGNDGRV
jgi:hypothetical protein